MAMSPMPSGPAHHSEHLHRPAMRHFPRQQPINLISKRDGFTSRDLASSETIGYSISVVDSSDDELPAPMKFSALTKALLNEEASSINASSIPAEGNNEEALASVLEGNIGTPFQHPLHTKEPPSENLIGPSPIPRRVVRLSGASGASVTLKRTASTSDVSSPRVNFLNSRSGSPQDLITPAPRPRSVQIRTAATYSSTSSAGSQAKQNDGEQCVQDANGEQPAIPSTNGRAQVAELQDSALRYTSSTVGRSKYVEENGLQGSLRIKRVGKVSGSFLSGPARRGRRRQSEEDQGSSQDDVKPSVVEEEEPSQSREYKESENVQGGKPANAEEHREQDDLLQPRGNGNHVHFNTGSPAQGTRETECIEYNSQGSKQSAHPTSSNASSKSSADIVRPTFKIPPLPPSLPSMHDQENEPPPTFRRNKPSSSALVNQVEKLSLPPSEALLGEVPATASSPRRALASRSQNTPRRPAPPPPKMTVLETATATAGAATTSQSRKKRAHVTINGKILTRLDCIGRGGSSRVYRVMAENYKIFALKKVVLEDVDAITIRGYKGEIELLRKLDHVDRVVKIFDWEINEEKQTLSVLMEIGESDLNRVLTYRMNADNAKFDISFARYYWKEMLECVKAVHEYGIVHSDLKPANFLLVQGRLKLIDFGIASAIQDDTVNVHREQLVGTPNYISPEAIVDTNAKNGLAAASGKIMKLGKPSDVWSLGCILYQMVYGKPPFAHITNPMQRIMAIPNPNHDIDFPDMGVGDLPVPVGLLKTLKGCLNRDQHQRPTIESLLDEKDRFLYPDAEREDVVEVSQDMLGRILANVIHHCKTNGVPTEAELAAWPAGFFGRIKKALREEG